MWTSRYTVVWFMLTKLSYPEHLSRIRFLSRAASLLTTMVKETPITEMMAETPRRWNMLKSTVRTEKGDGVYGSVLPENPGLEKYY